jgi:cell division protein FtsL
MPEFTQLGPTMGCILELKNNLKKEVSVAKAEMEKLRQESVQTGSEIKRQFKAASDEIREMGQQLQSMGMKMTIGVTLPLVAAGAVAVKTAADVEEMTNKFGVLFGSSSKDVEKWAAAHAQAVGRSRYDIMGYLADTQAVLTGLGMTTSEAETLSKQIVETSIDIASFHNAADVDVLQAYISALVGQTEPMRKFGSDVTDNTLKFYLQSQGIEANVEQMSFLEKATLRANIITTQQTAAQGDAARTVDSFTNQMKALQAAAKDMSVEFGEELIPYIQLMTRSLNDLIGWFNDLDTSTRKNITVVAMFVAGIGPALWITGKFAATIVSLTASTELFTLSALKATAATRGWTVALMTNPYTIALVAVTALAAGIIYFTTQAANAEDATKSLNNALSRTAKEWRDVATEARKYADQYREIHSLMSEEYYRGAESAYEERAAWAELNAEVREFYDIANRDMDDLNTAISSQRTLVSNLTGEYDKLVRELEDLKNIDEDIEDAGRSLEHAAINQIKAEERLAEVKGDPKSTATDIWAAELAYRDAIDAFESAEKEYLGKQEEQKTLLAGGTIEKRQSDLDALEERITTETQLLSDYNEQWAITLDWVTQIRKEIDEAAKGSQTVAEAWSSLTGTAAERGIDLTSNATETERVQELSGKTGIGGMISGAGAGGTTIGHQGDVIITVGSAEEAKTTYDYFINDSLYRSTRAAGYKEIG